VNTETVLSASAREVLYSSASIPLPSMEWAVDGPRETLAWQRNGGKGISIEMESAFSFCPDDSQPICAGLGGRLAKTGNTGGFNPADITLEQ